METFVLYALGTILILGVMYVLVDHFCLAPARQKKIRDYYAAQSEYYRRTEEAQKTVREENDAKWGGRYRD